MIPNRFRLCELFGIPIYLDFSLVILLVMFATDGGPLLTGLLSALLLLVSITAHELGHSLTARSFGYPTRDITLSLLGGCASLIALPRKASQEFLTAIAGPAVSFLASVWHNRGVALAGLMAYGRAAESFRQAWETDPREDLYRDYLAARRMELSEGDYVAFAAANADNYEAALALERDVEQLIRDWEETPEYLRLYNRRELSEGEGRQRYYEENEELARRLKDEYRRCVAE